MWEIENGLESSCIIYFKCLIQIWTKRNDFWEGAQLALPPPNRPLLRFISGSSISSVASSSILGRPQLSIGEHGLVQIKVE